MWLYIAGWFVLVVVGLTAFALRFAPNELAEIKALVRLYRARKEGRRRA